MLRSSLDGVFKKRHIVLCNTERLDEWLRNIAIESETHALLNSPNQEALPFDEHVWPYSYSVLKENVASIRSFGNQTFIEIPLTIVNKNIYFWGDPCTNAIEPTTIKGHMFIRGQLNVTRLDLVELHKQ